MRHSAVIWFISGAVSLGAHAGIMSALARISIQPPKDEALAEVVLAGDAFGAVTAEADTSQVVSSDAGQDVASATAGSPTVAQSDASGTARETDAKAAGATAAPSAAASLPATPADAASAAAEANQGKVAAAGQALAASTASAATAAAATQGDIAATGPSLPASTADAPTAADGSIALVIQPAAAGDLASPGSTGGTAAPVSPGNDQSAVAATDAAVAGNSSGTAAAASGDAPAAETAAGEATAAPAATATAAPAATATAASSAASPLILPQGTQVASIVTAVPAGVSQAEKIDRFLSSYKGGGCLYAMPDVADAAKPAFAGFGAQQGVTDFAAAFRQAVGVEPAMAIRPIMEAQCAAVDFLRELSAAKIPKVKLVLDAEVIADGGAITGHLEDDPKGEVRLLVIGDDGAVNDISKEFFRTKGTNFFYSQVVTNAEGRARNQIIVALVSSTPLTLTVTHQPGEAKALFEDLARQVKQPGTSVALGFSAFQVK